MSRSTRSKSRRSATTHTPSSVRASRLWPALILLAGLLTYQIDPNYAPSREGLRALGR